MSAPSTDRSLYADVRVVDLTGEPVLLTSKQWNPRRRRDPAQLRGIILHSWDTEVGTTAVNRAKYGEPEALARRGMKAEYTITTGVTRHGGEPVVGLVHPLERYTFASDAGCSEWLAIGVHGQFAFETDDAEHNGGHEFTPESPALVLAVGAAIDLAVRLLGGTSRPAPLALITHRQAVNGRGDHRTCPGEAVVRMAMQSEDVQRGLVVPDPDLVLVPDWGRDWPASWRRHIPAVKKDRPVTIAKLDLRPPVVDEPRKV